MPAARYLHKAKTEAVLYLAQNTSGESRRDGGSAPKHPLIMRRSFVPKHYSDPVRCLSLCGSFEQHLHFVSQKRDFAVLSGDDIRQLFD